MRLARDAGIGLFPWVSEFMADLEQMDETKPHPMKVFEKKFGSAYTAGIPGRYWIHPGGRALNFLRFFNQTHCLEEILDIHPESCAAELSDTSHFHMDPDGYYVPGLCSGLSIRAHDLGRPLSSDRYPIIAALYESGIRGLVDFARKHLDFSSDFVLKNYINKCDLCSQIRATLARKNICGPDELKPNGFYAQ
jgi:hypothetical protein